MKKVLSVILLLCVLLSLVACGQKQEEAPAAQAPAAEAPAEAPAAKEEPAKEPKVFKLGHNVTEDNTWHLGAVKFAEEVYEKSGGLMKIEVYPNAQLGDEQDVTRSVQQGTCDFNITGGGLQSWAPLAGLVECPYTFKNSEHLAAVANGPIGEEIAQSIIENAKVRPLCYFERGPRKLTSNKKIETPADLDNLIIRVPSSPLYVAAWEALGAKPTPMAFAEVFTGLQQGTIQGQENPLAMIDSGSLYEVQDYIMNTDHLVSYIYIVMGEAQWQALTAEEQQIIADAAKVAQEYEHELFLEAETALYDKMVEKGVEFVDVDYNAFRDIAVEGVKSQLTEEQAALYDQIIALG